MIHYYSSNGDIEKFTNSYPDNYIYKKTQLPGYNNDDKNFDSFPITVPNHDNFTLVGHTDFDGNNQTIDILEHVTIKKPEINSYPDFKDIIGECEQEIEIKFSETTHQGGTQTQLHFRFLLHKLDNGQPFYFCYYLSEEGIQYPMIWLTFVLRGKNELNKYAYLYTFQLNNLISSFDDFKLEYKNIRKKSIDYYIQLLKEEKIVFSYYVLKFGSSYQDNYKTTISHNDYFMDFNNSIHNGQLNEFYILGHNDFDNNLITKDNIKIITDSNSISINVKPSLYNYGHDITMKLSKIESIWRNNKTTPIENYGFYPVNITKKFNGKETNDFNTSGDFYFAAIKKSKYTENYMIIIYRLTKEVYKPIIDNLIKDGNSDYYLHYPVDEMENKKHTYLDIIHKYPYQWESVADIFNWIIVKPKSQNDITQSTDPNSLTKPVDSKDTNINNGNTETSSIDSSMYIIMFIVILIISYIIYNKINIPTVISK
jgi:hypothetical protein